MPANTFDFVDVYDDSLITDTNLKPLISARVTFMTQFLRMFPDVRTLRTHILYNDQTYSISLTISH